MHGNLAKKQAVELPPSDNDDLSTLLDMIPTNAVAPTTPALSDWCNSGPSSMVADDDLKLEMQRLASSLSMTHDWSFGPCSWDNIPSIR
ncbi:hypothetical protein KSP40_PGU019125 [Platanthera guangdongensis]|uniref:Uncharacterized protein n=1 Tax=Platanthera guangdongensis TaxID=2320717 RepID=A0ABR2LY24_9ASPA